MESLELLAQRAMREPPRAHEGDCIKIWFEFTDDRPVDGKWFFSASVYGRALVGNGASLEDVLSYVVERLKEWELWDGERN